jgi:hypothetical protein
MRALFPAAQHVAALYCLLPCAVACCVLPSLQVYMLLLGVTAMSLLTTPIVIMGSIHFLAKDGHGHQVYITGVVARMGVERPRGCVACGVLSALAGLALLLRLTSCQLLTAYRLCSDPPLCVCVCMLVLCGAAAQALAYA